MDITVACREDSEKTVIKRANATNGKVIEVPKTSCQESVEVEQTMQRAVELLLDTGHGRALRKLEKFREKLRKRMEQFEKERSPSFSSSVPLVKSDQHW